MPLRGESLVDLEGPEEEWSLKTDCDDAADNLDKHTSGVLPCVREREPLRPVEDHVRKGRIRGDHLPDHGQDTGESDQEGDDIGRPWGMFGRIPHVDGLTKNTPLDPSPTAEWPRLS